MRAQDVKTITASTLMVLLFSSFVAITGGMNSVQAQKVEASSSEVTAASGSNRFLVWSDITPGNWEIFFRRSTDNGATWKPTVNLSNNVGSSSNPEIFVSGANVYLVWAQSNADNTLRDINFRRSTDNGATWKPIVKIASGVGTSTPQVASSGSNVYVVWEQNNSEIHFRRSADSGATWKTITNLSNNPGASLGEQIGVSGNNVYVMWFQRNADGTKADVFFIRSTDNGATWKSKVNLSNSGEVFSANVYPDMAVSGSSIHAVWNDNGQVMIRSSADSGASWKAIKTLSNLPAEDNLDSLVAASGSNVYVLYVQRSDPNEISTATCGTEQLIELTFVASGDNAVTWKAPVTIYEQLDGCGDQWVVPHLLAIGSNVYAAWRYLDFAFSEAFFRASTDNGVTWGEITSLVFTFGRGQGLYIAASGSSVYLVVWSKGEVYLHRSLDNGETLEPKKNLSNNSGRSITARIGV